MKKILTLLTGIILFYNIATAQMTERDTVFDRFRSVVIQNGLKIELQANIKTIKDVTIKSIENHYYLKKGAFIRADSIDIETNKKEQIIAITFFYSGTDYESMKKIYTKPLGEGEELISGSAGVKTKTVLWEDDKTIFELVEIINNNGIRLCSVIFDKQLYSRKYKKK